MTSSSNAKQKVQWNPQTLEARPQDRDYSYYLTNDSFTYYKTNEEKETYKIMEMT